MKSFTFIILVLSFVPLVASAQTERAYAAATLNEARAGFESLYGFNPVDCDPINNEWVCSEFQVSASTLLALPEPSSPTSELSSCVAYGSTVQDAQSAFSAECSWRTRERCDLLSSGEWACTTEIATTSNQQPIVSTPVSQESSCTAYGSTIDAAQESFSSVCPWRDRNYCNQSSVGQWACSTDVIQTTTAEPDIDNVTSDTSTVDTPAPQGTTLGTGVINATYQSGDLVVIAHDSGPDTDDMQAIVANRMIMDAYPTVNYILVGAAQGHAWTNPTNGSEAHTQSLFADWINAKASTSGTTSFDGTSIISVTDLVGTTLNNRGTVHIAEGGPSDFTAEILRLLQSRGFNATELKRIRVVQHSAGPSAWNEQQTSGANISLVKSVATWVPIANGNVGGNATADFQEPASSAMCQRFRNAALSTQYASQWAWAYSVIDDTRKCDQSDSVELLHILNDTSTKTFDQFVSRYM